MNRSTQRHAFALEYVKTVGVHNNATMGRGFASPVDLAVSGDGRIYVLNRGPYARVGVCNLDEDYLYEFGSLGDGDGQFRLASAIALDNRGRVYVAGEHHSHINVFEHSGEFVGRWGQSGSGNGQMDGPSGLVFDRDDRLFVADQNNNRVSVFTSRGAHIRSWGEPGDEERTAQPPLGHRPGRRRARVRRGLAQRPCPEVHGGRRVSRELRRPGKRGRPAAST